MNTTMPPAVNEQSASDTSSLISSPPQSPQNNNVSADEIAVARPNRPTSALGGGVVGTPAHVTQNHTPSAPNAPQLLPQPQQPTPAPTKPKQVRKPRAPKVDSDGQPIPVVKKPRKPREPKVKAEGAPQIAPRKKQKVEDKTTPAPAAAVPSDPRQSMMSQFYPPGQPASAPQHLAPHPSTLAPSPQPQHQPTSDNMSNNHVTPHPLNQPPPPTSRPYSSGQNYDPIRGAYSAAPSRPAAVTNGTQSAQASPQINRASASPSIQSLIDPPQHINPNTSTTSYAQQANLQPQTQQAAQQTASFVNHPTTSPRPTPVPAVAQSLPTSPLPQQQPPAPSSMDGAMDIDVVSHEPPKQPTIKPQPQSKSSSSAPTPKPSKPVSPPAKAASKVGTGSGLLSTSSLFGGPSSEQDSEPKGLTIEFRIPLNPAGGNQINIAKEIIKKYGSDAVDPHAAAHRNRLRAIALAQNKIEPNSTDDMSVDLGSEMGDDSNVEMGGMDDERSGAGEPVKKRRKKVDNYDKEDDFIDDRELAWEENAAVAKDGFFVYSGPLIAEGEAAQVESSSAPTRGRGGTRGRGRGSRGGAGSAASATSSTAAAARKDPNAPAVPARGRGSRGGRVAAQPAKKRPTKAEKEAKEQAAKEQAAKAEFDRKQKESQAQLQQGPTPTPNPMQSPANGMGIPPPPVQPQHVLGSNYGPTGMAGGGEATAQQQQQQSPAMRA